MIAPSAVAPKKDIDEAEAVAKLRIINSAADRTEACQNADLSVHFDRQIFNLEHVETNATRLEGLQYRFKRFDVTPEGMRPKILGVELPETFHVIGQETVPNGMERNQKAFPVGRRRCFAVTGHVLGLRLPAQYNTLRRGTAP